VIAALMEVERRRLHLGEGCPSLFVYCTDVLHFSEHSAYLRIEAARTARRIPRVLELLADGSLTLTTVGLLKAHLTEENHRELLEAARHKSKRDVERMIAALKPLPAVPSSVRKLPSPKAADTPALAMPVMPAKGSDERIEEAHAAAPPPPPDPSRPAIVTPLAPERYKVQVTISRGTRQASARAGIVAAHHPKWGSRRHFRASALLIGGRSRAQAVRGCEEPSPGRQVCTWLTPHPGSRQTSGLGA
jgi:hypothetical protein